MESVTKFSQDELNLFYAKLREKKVLLSRAEKSAEREELSGWSPDDTGEVSHSPTHKADFGTDTQEQDLVANVAGLEISQIEDIEDAMSRIDSGKFGICEDCKEPIARARLEVMPEARYCTECELIHERTLSKRKEGGGIQRMDEGRA